MLSLLRDLYPSEHSHSNSFLNGDYFSPPPRIHFNVIRPRIAVNDIARRASSAKNATDKFQVILNVNHFKPDEVDVKIVDNFVVIHGKHEEHVDEHGFVSREFTRRYQIPDYVEPSTVISSLSRDGVLTIQAPRKSLEPPKNERIVPITIQQPAAVEEAQKQQIQEQNAHKEPMQQ